MAKISALPLADAATGDELVPVVQDGETRSIRYDALAADLIAAGQAMANYRATFADAVMSFEVGSAFTCDEDGPLSVYRRTAEDPFFTFIHEVPSRSLVEGKVSAADLASTDEGKGADIPAYRAPSDEAVPRTAKLKLNEMPVSSLDLGLAQDGSSDSFTPLRNFSTGGGKRLHFAQSDAINLTKYAVGPGVGTAFYATTGGIEITFDKDVRLVPYSANGGVEDRSNSPTRFFYMQGAAPGAGQYIPLSADSYEGVGTVWVENDPRLNTGTPGVAGDPGPIDTGVWIHLISDALLPRVPNSKSDKRAMIAKVGGVYGSGPYAIVLDRPLPYDFSVGDNAAIGTPRVVEGITIEAPAMGLLGATGPDLMKTGIQLDWCADFRIIAPRCYGSKLPYELSVPGTGLRYDFIRLTDCVDGVIEDAQGIHGTYYGIGLVGACENIEMRGGTFTDCRHAVSIVWRDGGYGAPRNIRHIGMTARECTVSGFDVHDTGELIFYTDCLSESNGDDGFQDRAGTASYVNCIAKSNNIDGFSGGTGGNTGLLRKAVGCTSEKNGRCGVSWPDGTASWIGGEVSRNGSNRRWGYTYDGADSITGGDDDPVANIPPAANADDDQVSNGYGDPPGKALRNLSGAAGIQIARGHIKDVTMIDNGNALSTYCIALVGGALDPVKVSGVIAPRSDIQQRFIGYSDASQSGYITMRDNEIPGYNNNVLYYRGNASAPSTHVPPLSSGNVLAVSSTTRSGVATLDASGEAVVANAAFRVYEGTTSAAPGPGPVRSKIELTPIDTTGAVYLVPGADGVGFTIKSAAGAADSGKKVRWENTV